MLRYVSNPRDARMTQRSDEQKSSQTHQKCRQDSGKLAIRQGAEGSGESFASNLSSIFL